MKNNPGFALALVVMVSSISLAHADPSAARAYYQQAIAQLNSGKPAEVAQGVAALKDAEAKLGSQDAGLGLPSWSLKDVSATNDVRVALVRAIQGARYADGDSGSRSAALSVLMERISSWKVEGPYVSQAQGGEFAIPSGPAGDLWKASELSFRQVALDFADQRIIAEASLSLKDALQALRDAKFQFSADHDEDGPSYYPGGKGYAPSPTEPGWRFLTAIYERAAKAGASADEQKRTLVDAFREFALDPVQTSTAQYPTQWHPEPITSFLKSHGL